MAIDFPEPKNVWQKQATENFEMSLEQLKCKAQKRAHAARRAVLSAMGLGLVLCGWFAWGATRQQQPISRIALVVLSLWSLYYAFHGYRWIWPAQLHQTDAVTTVRRYRTALEKRRNYLRQIWTKGGLVVCFLAMGMFLWPTLIQTLRNPHRVISLAPIFVLAVIWLALFIPSRRRRIQTMQREIDELRVLEGQLR